MLCKAVIALIVTEMSDTLIGDSGRSFELEGDFQSVLSRLAQQQIIGFIGFR